MRKIIISISVIVVSISLFSYLTHLGSNDDIGEITIDIIDENGAIISNVYGFDIDDSLFGILDDNHTVKCASASYQITDNCTELIFGSKVVLQVDSVITNWNDNFISIYENDVYSNLGIDSIILNDGDHFAFKFQEVGGN